MMSPGPDLPSDLVEVRADIEIPERRIKMVFFIRRDFDQVQQATSHFIEIMFYLPDKFPFGGIANVPGVLMKQAEQTRGSPLGGTADKVTANYFFIGLSAVKPDMQRNIQLLKERGWFDIPIVYNNGRRAILTIEKGTSGERVFQEAFKIWDGPSPGQPADISVPKGVQTLPLQSAPSGDYVVQVSAQKTEDEARASYQVLQQKYPSVLSGRDPIIRRAELGQSGTWYRVHVGSFATSEQATALCNNLKDAGGQCIVQRDGPDRSQDKMVAKPVQTQTIKSRLNGRISPRHAPPRQAARLDGASCSVVSGSANRRHDAGYLNSIMARAACHHHCGRVDPGESRTQGNAMSLRITAAGAVAFATLSFLTVPASACDERYIQKCERAARAWLPAQLAGLFQPRPASCTAGFRFCHNCARTIYVFTRKNTPCMIRYRAFYGAMLSQRVTKRGSGIYGTANPTIGAYQPKPGYVGKDYFEVEVSYERSGTRLKTTLQADVTITD